jgi:hypothetical protein
MKRRIWYITLGTAVPLLAILAILFTFSAELQAAEPNLRDECTVPGSYATIQAAVDDLACSVILVGPGTFTENITINSRVLTIQGQGPLSTIIDGNDQALVFNITSGSSVTLTGLAVRNGHSYFSQGEGGGILNQGRTELLDCLVIDNRADGDYFGTGRGGGVCNVGVMRVDRCVLSNNFAQYGGGLHNRGVVTITNSTIVSNSTEYGGGVDGWGGELTMAGSTVSNNVNYGLNNFYGAMFVLDSEIISNTGIGLLNYGVVTVTGSTIAFNGGTGISGWTGSVDGRTIIVDSTIAHNADGGIRVWTNLVLPKLQIINSTVVSNIATGPGGGIYVGSTVDATILSSIVAGNAAEDCSGPITSLGYNIASDGSCELTGPGDMDNTDPLLGPLADNGGPTWTHLPLLGSPAVDNGDNATCPTTDQRGYPRPKDGDGDGEAVCDIGSVEVQGGWRLYLPVVSLPESTAAGLGKLSLAGLILSLPAGLWLWLGRVRAVDGDLRQPVHRILHGLPVTLRRQPD